MGGVSGRVFLVCLFKFPPKMKILILGDGNFSFSLAFSKEILENKKSVFEWLNIDTATIGKSITENKQQTYITENNSSCAESNLPSTPKTKTDIQLYCTSFDSFNELVEKYHDSRDILKQLESLSKSSANHGLTLQVRHEINAWELLDAFPCGTLFDYIIWNHPHLGEEDFKLHQFLMAHFFESACQVLDPQNPNASIRLSLVQGQETRWNVFNQAERCHLHLDSFQVFNEQRWPGYVVKRNKHGGSFKNIHTKRHVRTEMKSGLYTFNRKPQKFTHQEIKSLLQETFGNEYDQIFSFKQLDKVLSDLTPPKKSNNICKEMRKQKLASVPVDFTCKHCGKQLSNSRGYLQHVHTVHVLEKFGKDWSPNRPKCLDCPFDGCSKQFTDKEALFQHTTNKHTSISVGEELPDSHDAKHGKSVAENNDYDYYPCPVCGQSCIKQDWGMLLHLESLKPAVGLKMKCPLCPGVFIEQRALFQHYKFCRLKVREE